MYIHTHTNTHTRARTHIYKHIYIYTGLLKSDTAVSPILYRRYFFNIAQGIANTFLRKYRMLYRRFFFWSKIRYLSDNFLLMDSFFNLDIRIWCQPLPASRLLLWRDAMWFSLSKWLWMWWFWFCFSFVLVLKFKVV